ncbi:DUF4139 domain-containing protein [Psychrobacter lutiphocae]|uniref:DUF4139 domain-containing protein n=1 Tax=Psychrobacter lutiphocae TaxID=540500 RepID=UPI00036AB929|nr:DUF4139 domain-containing protein [Psychrobacter lutiphocae]
MSGVSVTDSKFKHGKLKQAALKLSMLATSTAFGLIMTHLSAHANISQIEEVTIYQGLASVTRSLPIHTNGSKNGEQVLLFSCLSPKIDDNSISVQASPGINIGEISIRRVSGEQANLCCYQDDSNARDYQDKLDNINAELEATKLTQAYLTHLTKASNINIEGGIGKQANELQTQAAHTNKRLIQLQQQQAKMQDDLDQLMASVGNTNSNNNTVTQVSVRMASRGSGTVKLHYQVQGASWQPSYQARLDTNTGQLAITASAVIAQQTGENWNNIPVVLSTVNPNQSTANRLPRVSYFDLYEIPPQREELVPTPAPVIVMGGGGADRVYAEAAADEQMPLPSFDVSSAHKNGITEYRLPQKVSIASDGRRVRTKIDEKSGQSSLWLRSTPEVEQKAYWYATAPFITPEWADGSMQLYRDDNYIGQTQYNYQRLTEQGIGFGSDTNIVIKQLTDDTVKGDAGGVFNQSRQQTRVKAYQFTNLHNRTVQLEVLGSEPVSRDSGIKLETTHTPAVTTQKWNDQQGVVAWKFELAPQQTQTVKTTTTISYPAKKRLIER